MNKLSAVFALNGLVPLGKTLGTNILHTAYAPATLKESWAISLQQLSDFVQVNLLDDRGGYDASTNLYPAPPVPGLGGSGIAGAINKGDLWEITVPGTLGGVEVAAGQVVRSLVDVPGQTASNWLIGAAAGFGPVFTTSNAGRKIYYSSIQDGIDAQFTAGGGVVSLNAGLTEDIVMKAGVHINGNGYTITGADTTYTVTMSTTVDSIIYNTIVDYPGAAFSAMRVTNTSKISLPGTTLKGSVITMNLADGSVKYGKASGGILSCSAGTLIEDFIHDATSNAISAVGATVRNCTIGSDTGWALSAQSGAIIENSVFNSNSGNALVGSDATFFNARFISQTNAAASFNHNPGVVFVSTYKNCHFISKWNNAGGHAVDIANTNTSKHRMIGCYYETAHASAYGVNAGAAQTALIKKGEFNTTLNIHANITLDNRTSDPYGNVSIN